MTEIIDSVVVGAGVIGLAIARQLAVLGHEVFVLDREMDFGLHTSSRNSEVIHAGLYYPPGSLKAALCVRGKALLYDYCRRRGVPHRQLGKIIFATRPSDEAVLDAIEANGRGAGVEDLRRLGRAEVGALEPALDCQAALLSPSTGIVDSRALMTSFLEEISAAGGSFVGRSEVTHLSRQPGGWGLHLGGEAEPMAVARNVINAAGLHARTLADHTEGLDARFRPRVRYARGVYFTYSGKVPFSHLIYPVPVPGGLGTHLTLDLAGGARFGPDVEWIEDVDYSIDPGRKPAFLAAARAFWPDIDPDRLSPGYAGVRPKLSGPGEPQADFAVMGPAEHGLEGLVNLFGIESPGLTSALALAEDVVLRLEASPRSEGVRLV
ncbi:NAD(P)/FAD-dependent oxidoreductase [Rubellimicrobium arenae]|uniref:NAD(P)/FAD-dependent oxidoreductase n=1 Tax=Rubellimicrobium arenae TaxID=2817372 RepID=UPI001B30FA58|nr:NAD(P)/FAD-dependent oxidoreductase [Rubellimicrobium arenae]